MNVEIVTRPNTAMRAARESLLLSADLHASTDAESYVLVYDGDTLVATGARDGAILKYIAVSEDRRGEDLTATVISHLRADAFKNGYSHLFLYTKPKNLFTFSQLFFYEVASADDVLLMESRQGGFADFVSSLPYEKDKCNGALVMNCNPFTLGHRHLIERASAECERVYLFVLSEDKSRFSFEDRLEMVKRGVCDIENVCVLPTGPYMISSATFPSYFLPDRDAAGVAQCSLDVEIFAHHVAKRLSIKKRYVGTEPFSSLTAKYNAELKIRLPEHGIECIELDRAESDGVAISASAVRKHIDDGNIAALSALLPQTTIEYLKEKNLI